MSKTYTLLLNSQNSVNRSGTTTTNYTYYVNWKAVLPTECKKFDVSYSLKSVLGTTLLTDVVLLSMNIGNQSTYDQTYSQTPIVCALNPSSNVGTVYYYYQSNVTDQCGFMVGYPQNSFLNIKLLNSTPVNGAYALTTSFPDYILQISFTEIEDFDDE